MWYLVLFIELEKVIEIKYTFGSYLTISIFWLSLCQCSDLLKTSVIIWGKTASGRECKGMKISLFFLLRTFREIFECKESDTEWEYPE